MYNDDDSNFIGFFGSNFSYSSWEEVAQTSAELREYFCIFQGENRSFATS